MATLLVCLAWLRDSVLFAVTVGWLVYWLVKLVAGTESKKEENIAPVTEIPETAAKQQAVAEKKKSTEETESCFPELPKSTQPYVQVPADEFAPKPVAGTTEEDPTEEEVLELLLLLQQQNEYFQDGELAVAGTEEEGSIEEEIRRVPAIPEATQQTVSVPVDEFAPKPVAGITEEDSTEAAEIKAEQEAAQ
eukprot:CAMPEP_0198199964 /NCGR_PEP_ID=MMETSP1445-20131203/3057_1 /TAXON_ID=36898 /ORGANISM="Pyramimonas sp., Strain CCMP2087" /LENGTH=191 /DNA_ID=CAMNT_0043869881 /DNA_START=45 /DNA_END=617 /DNA_ORIENTATION=-